MKKIEKVRLELSDWLYNAGIVGLCKIFDTSDVNYKADDNYIEFDETALENFEEKYFKYFIDKYISFTSWYKIVKFEDKLIRFDENEVDERYVKDLNEQIEYMKSKLKSASYKSAYQIIDDKEIDLLKEEKKLKKVSKTKKQSIKDILPKIKKQNEVIGGIIKYLKKDNVKKIILGKNVIYDIITKFWSDVSFLHKNSSKNDMYLEYKKYFLDNMINYLKSKKDNFKYSCFSCDRLISNLSKPNSYDLTWINKMGVDMSRKTSHFWNFYGDIFICPICNLVYSCIPAGFTVIRDKGIFINQNSDINTLIKVNNTAIDNNTSFQELEEKTYFAIVDNLNQSQIERAEKEIDNIQIVKLDSSNSTRPYTFNIMSKKKLRIIKNNKKLLRGLVNVSVKIGRKNGRDIYINLYTEVINRLYDDKKLFDLISKLFYLNLDDKFKKLWNLKTIIKINDSYIGGIMGRGIYYKEIDQIQQIGFDLRKAYKEKNAENKINGISYRLLNALKTKNSSKFMETLFNAYMYLNKAIPVKFIDVLKDEDKFQTIGYSFLLGLQGEIGKLDFDKEKECSDNE
ncbi:CRISPR-associated protein Cst1 [Caminicella sporogenes DSM 14501]|uniref:CRISPR-associated protein Cst1 n=1 Tax=Caminicella sporogenes DSM 14501 TaxID=1121266 RepID=A0A1M6TNR5_9FIRM|nr:type I-B CRISPR-associated protein Cas8b1/Cst1 [Caminicella sporogenes]RKD24801.1 type I-B CRISPR-associated protein Cas8b1/Cst1 [Caminicella sporogenes]SHK58591.1 CRISPR-associated protein Cst1 [Caminicella sporogenes DSM 14501]